MNIHMSQYCINQSVAPWQSYRAVEIQQGTVGDEVGHTLIPLGSARSAYCAGQMVSSSQVNGSSVFVGGRWQIS
jgi:hypothetical protein